MKQILQDLVKGGSTIIEAPTPKLKPKHLLISTKSSLISVGTERMLVEFGKGNLFEKARQQPDKVKMVLEKVKTDGLLTTVDAVKSKLGQPIPLGYCNVGVVSEVGSGSQGFKIGDRVASNGAHADVVRVPHNLCAVIPDDVSDQEAAFTVVASIGLQGIRLANPTLGETFVVIGAGLIGLLTIQLLIAHGCRVLAVDFDEEKLKLAQRFGAEVCNPAKGEDPIKAGIDYSRGLGVDGVVITASTKSSDPVVQAARMSRKRGRVILVGVTGLELNRSDFYVKELSFQVSCSYGPGRYDPEYEDKGNDYPLAYVRWTEQRNFTAVLDMMAKSLIDVKPLITHKFEFEQAESAYDVLSNDHSALGIVLEYSDDPATRYSRSVLLKDPSCYSASQPVIGFIGAGNYASRVLIPEFSKAGAQLHTIATSGGVNSVIHGNKNGFQCATTEIEDIMGNKEINTVAIVTQHNTHAELVCDALSNGKNVFVEKPLAITLEELERVKSSYEKYLASSTPPKLMVGFNRRFSPQVRKMKSLLDSSVGPKTIIAVMNAGEIPLDHWTQQVSVGGGRIIGEACHFIDLMRFLAGSEIESVQARRLHDESTDVQLEDKATITLGFRDGSMGTIHYFANGASSFPKERVEVFSSGKILLLDNFRKLKGFGWPKFNKMNLWRQDKGQATCIEEFLSSIQHGQGSPISAEELFEVARVSIEASQLLRNQQ